MKYLTLRGAWHYVPRRASNSVSQVIDSVSCWSAMTCGKREFRSLLDALAELRELPLDLLLVGREDPAPFRAMVEERALSGRVYFLPPRKGYRVLLRRGGRLYTGPSLEDTFALPPAEAMACGLPVIVSAENGTFEIITHNSDGMVLNDPADAKGLAAMIRKLLRTRNFDPGSARMLSKRHEEYTWEANGHDLARIFEEVLKRKLHSNGQSLARVS